jgi:hypothetical protein
MKTQFIFPIKARSPAVCVTWAKQWRRRLATHLTRNKKQFEEED